VENAVPFFKTFKARSLSSPARYRFCALFFVAEKLGLNMHSNNHTPTLEA